MPPKTKPTPNQTISEHLTIACKIVLDHIPEDDVLITFMQKQFPSFTINHFLTQAWYYGRVFNTSSGIHGEFHTPDEKILSLLYLGSNEEQALEMMKNITQQNIYILSLKDLY